MNQDLAYDDMPVEPERNTHKKRKKHRLRKFLIFMIAVIFIWWFNNYTLRINEYTVKSDKITSGFRIAVMSDLHATANGISNDTIIGKIEKANPDIVFMLGDMYTKRSSWDEIEIPVQLASELIQRGYPVYFVSGEHDTGDDYFEALEEVGVHVMNYKGEVINVCGNNVQILGIDNVYFSSTFDLNNVFTPAQDCYTILMAHIPNYEAYASFGADLTICGDTHGGMIQLPFDMGPVYDNNTGEWFPELLGDATVSYDKGLFPYDGGTMMITSGIGASPVPVRLNNRPEIAVVDIQPD
jgi:hypothetical protein